VPFQRRIIQMPMAVNAPLTSSATERNRPAPVVGIRLEQTDRGIVKLILIAVASLVAIWLVAISFTRVGELRQKRIEFSGRDQTYLNLTNHDDSLAVVQKMGRPTTDRQQETGTTLYRALGYPERHYSVILMGRDPSSMVYVGTMDADWHVLYAVNAQDEALLRTLKRF
jgi:hypothetical protein